MNIYTTMCPDCGWTSSQCRSQAQADYALRLHSCERYRRLTTRAEAHAARRAAVDRTPKPCAHKETTHVHGTHACYVLDRCRCLECTDARTQYERTRTRKKAYGRWDGLIDAEPTRNHILALMAAGLGIRQIQRRAGLRGTGSMARIVYGTPGEREPAARVTPATAARYLAIPIPTPDTLAAGACIPALPAQRRLRALARLGWSVQSIADRYDVDRQRLDRAIHGLDVLVATDQLVRRIYDDLWDNPAPETSHRERISASRTRRHAETQGWAPPLAWDDDNIDLPGATPANTADIEPTLDEIAIAELIGGRPCITGRAEIHEAVRRMTEAGLGAEAIAERIGVTGRTVVRYRAAA